MEPNTYLSVLVPLRLEWIPCYRLGSATCPADGRVGQAGRPDEATGREATEGGKAAPAPALSPGTRVEVRFAGRRCLGVVYRVGVRPETDPSRIQEILAVRNDLPPVTPQELRLWEFIASYYLCTLGEVLKAAYPDRKVGQEEVRTQLHRRQEERDRRLRESLKKRWATLEARCSAKREQAARARKESTRAAFQAALEKAEADLARTRLALERLTASRADEEPRIPVETGITLSPGQTAATDRIRTLLQDGRIALLRGVTGAGKTEIYIKLAAETLRKGRNVLYLVPEIAMSRQLETRLGTVFGDLLLTFHSAESPARREQTASAVRSRPYLVLGTRSALFLPHRDLGLVIVDEEHDASYKQDAPAPRYNGRDAAVILGSLFGCGVLLGSATPSAESLYNVHTGRYGMVVLDKKYFEAPDAELEIIDTRAERRKNGMVGSFSRKLLERIRETLAAGGQVVLLRARRSYAPAVQCPSCGDIPRCPHCNVPLSLHRHAGGGDLLVCHYCGRSLPLPKTCSRCGGTYAPLGAGTQRIEEEVRTLFPEASVARLDGDTARSPAYAKTVIQDFAAGRTDILIGTQMVTKGFDFQGLMLVAVLGADALVGQQDFRADERALQLLEQFRGRCGRRGTPGRFVIQTAQPGHPVYRQLAGSPDDPAMLAERRAFRYPPFFRLIHVHLRDRDAERLEQLAPALADRLSDALGAGPGVLLTGPFPPAVDRVADEHLLLIRIHLAKDGNLTDRKAALRQCVLAFEEAHHWNGHVTLDVDPA